MAMTQFSNGRAQGGSINLTWDNLSDAIFQYAEERPSVENGKFINHQRWSALVYQTA
jgi:hypothetical protein